MVPEFKYKVGEFVGPQDDRREIMGILEAATKQDSRYRLKKSGQTADDDLWIWVSAQTLDDQGEGDPIPPPDCPPPGPPC